MLVIISNYTIEKYSDGKTTDDISKIKNNKVGLVLGTSKTLKDGRINLYFKYRIQAVIEFIMREK